MSQQEAMAKEVFFRVVKVIPFLFLEGVVRGSVEAGYEHI